MIMSPLVATVITASSIVTWQYSEAGSRRLLPGCNSDNCKQYCDLLSAFGSKNEWKRVATVITARDSHFFVKKCGKKLNRCSDSVAYVQRVPMVKR